MSSAASPVAHPLRLLIERARERLDDKLGRRATAAIAALMVEALLVLALLSLGEFQPPHKTVPLSLSSFDVREAPPAKPPPQPEQKSARATAQPKATQPTPQPTAAPMPKPAAIIPLSPELRNFDLAKLPKATPTAAPKHLVGPVDTPRFGDSERVGTAPNGQPMYAAAWYPHEPTREELGGYLSTAEPGWALITCKTVPDYRVEDCVGLDEYPENSHLLRAVLAAAWQFRVRPPRVGGVLQVGDWVRIKITYEFKPAGNPYGDPTGP